MRNKRKEQELKEQIIALRTKRKAVEAELNQRMLDLYIAIGVHPDQAVKML